jgi:hypothetical protein
VQQLDDDGRCRILGYMDRLLDFGKLFIIELEVYASVQTKLV